MSRKLWSITILIAVLLAGCGGQATQPPAVQTEEAATEEPEAGRTLVFAEISNDPVETTDRFQPLMDYLAENLSKYGITSGEVRVAPDIETLTEWMGNGEVDLFFDSAYPALSVAEPTGAQPILRRWRSGVGEYHSVIFARADSGITSLADLKGKIIGFETPYSTTAYFLPTAMLLEAGLTLIELPDPGAEVPADQVGYVFSGDDENHMQWVVSELVAAGATDNATFEEDFPPETRDQLVIIARSITIPRQIVLVKADMDDGLVEAIKELLIGLEQTEEGLAILDTARTTKFDEFPGGADAALAEIRELFDLVAGQ